MITILPTERISALTVKNIYESFTHKMAAKASWHQNYVTVTVCISRQDTYLGTGIAACSELADKRLTGVARF